MCEILSGWPFCIDVTHPTKMISIITQVIEILVDDFVRGTLVPFCVVLLIIWLLFGAILSRSEVLLLGPSRNLANLSLNWSVQVSALDLGPLWH
jgi:hypothetical protein